MNSKVIVPIVVSITIIIIAFSIIQTGSIKESPPAIEKEFPDDPKLQKIMEDKIKNDNSENPFVPKEREWIESGPFKIDRSSYLLGEKIFFNIDQLSLSDKGKVIILRPLNDTHYTNYYSMPFDGSKNRNNFYLTPDLSIVKKICNKDELVGDWKIIFEGTNYSFLEFKIIDQILPGNEKRYEEKC